MLLRRLLTAASATLGRVATEVMPRINQEEVSGLGGDGLGGGDSGGDFGGDGDFGDGFGEGGGDFGDGFGEDEGDFEGGDDSGAGMFLDMMGAYASDFEECGLDLSGFMEDTADDDIFPMILEQLKLSPPCTETEKNTMRNELMSFSQCSGYEVIELDETFIMALVGAVMRCANSMTMMDMASMDIPEQCAAAVLGNHPLGKALRDFILRPGETGDCFLQLSHKVPQCSLDLWPYPIDGKAIKTGACVSSTIENLLNQQCIEGLQGLDSCLPANKDDIASGNCDSYLQECGNSDSMYVVGIMMMPPHLRGLPLPDTCTSAAMSQGLGSVVDRYDTFRTTCASSGAALWAKLDSDTGPAMESFQDFLQVDKTPKTTEPEEESTITKSEEENLVNSQYPVEPMGNSDSDDKGRPATHSFGYGTLTGLLLAGLSYFALVLLRKKRSGGRIGFSSVELGNIDGEEDKNATYSDLQFT
jgi:hypothetical protein